MPLFGLTPLPSATQAEAWESSTYHGLCYVMAADERQARLYAASHFSRPDTPRLPSGLRMESPWMMSRLVAAHLAVIPLGQTVPVGTVLVPEELSA